MEVYGSPPPWPGHLAVIMSPAQRQSNVYGSLLLGLLCVCALQSLFLLCGFSNQYGCILVSYHCVLCICVALGHTVLAEYYCMYYSIVVIVCFVTV